MFGIYRYALAHMVVVGHLYPTLSAWSGRYAVFAFYLLSGYLMALVLNGAYRGYRATPRFLANRALRVHPPYWVVLIMTVPLLVWIPEIPLGLNRAFGAPESAEGWLRALVIFGVNRENFRAVPPAWSLHVELCWYLLMALGLARNRWIVVAWFAASVVYTGLLVAWGAPMPYRYLPIEAASLPFSFGALIYYFRGRHVGAGAGSVAITAGVFALTAALPAWTGSAYGGIFYLSLLAAAALTWSLARVDPLGVSPRLRRVDRILGDLAYPVFLVHWWSAAVIAWLVFDGATQKSASLFAASVVVANVAAVGIHWTTERPIARLRTALRGRPAPVAP